MKVVIFILAILFLPRIDQLNELMIFNSMGEVKLFVNNSETNKPQGLFFNPNDSIIVIDGSITIINKNNKRITLDKTGTYKYTDITKMIEEAEASLTTQYYRYVWEKMSHSHPEVNIDGGVIRGDEYLLNPDNNIIILSDSIKFNINNLSPVYYEIIFQSENSDFIKKDSIQENLEIAISDINYGKSGRYFWRIKTKTKKIEEIKSFIIPEKSIKDKYLTDIESFKREASSFNDELCTMLIDEYLQRNKLYLRY